MVLHLLGESFVVDFAPKIHKRHFFSRHVRRNAQLQRAAKTAPASPESARTEPAFAARRVQRVVFQLEYFLVRDVHQLNDVETFQLKMLGRQRPQVEPGGGCAPANPFARASTGGSPTFTILSRG
jgi:hypothetical protein